jgi:hypothetical protein
MIQARISLKIDLLLYYLQLPTQLCPFNPYAPPPMRSNTGKPVSRAQRYKKEKRREYPSR